MSHTVIAEFHCNEGQGAAMLAFLKDTLVGTRAFEGNELIEVYTDQDNPDLVVLWEKWTKRDDQAAYLAWRRETGFSMPASLMDPKGLRIVHLEAHSDV